MTIDIDGKPGQFAALPAGANVALSQFVDPTAVRHVPPVDEPILAPPEGGRC